MEKGLVTSESNTLAKLASCLENANIYINTTAFHWNFSAKTNSSSNDTDISLTPGVRQDLSYVDLWNNNPYELISVQAYEITAKIIQEYVGPMIFVIGVPTNILSALVFYKQGLRDRMNLCLFVLALVDGFFIASSFVGGFSSFLDMVDIVFFTKYTAIFTVYIYFFTLGMKSASACISMVVAVERCVCVVFPLRANSIMRTRTMGALLAAIVILNLLAHSIFCFQYKMVLDYNEALQLSYYRTDVTDSFLQNPMLFHIIYNIFLAFVLPLLTFVVVSVATAITVIKLRTAMAWRARTSSGKADNHSQQQQAALTKMLVILSCVFMACAAPYTALSIVRLLVPDFSVRGRYVKFYWASHIVCGEFIAPINSSVNFFVYCARSSRFRIELRELFGCRKAKNKRTDQKPENSVTAYTEF